MSDYNRTDKNNKNNSSDPSWLLIVIAFAVFWPVGLALLIYKLSQSKPVQDAKRDWQSALEDLGQHHPGQQAYQPPKQAAQTTQNPSRQNRSQPRQESRQTRRTSSGARSDRRSPASLKRGNVLTVVGAIIAILFGTLTCHQFLYWMPGSLWYALQDAVLPFICTGLGAGMFAWGRIRHRQGRRLRKMLNMLGKQKVIDIRALAEAFPTSYSKACDDIQDLIDGGYLGNGAYINMSTGQLILDSDGFQAPPRPAPVQEPDVDQDQLLLAEIRRVNDAIPDEEMSRKIYRIEECTQHILEHLKKHPEKSTELHTFLDYYLPTTLKILNAYAELDHQSIQGENVTATKERIEAMMDSVVEGFEAQLDKLFEGDMIDISADIDVMEKMLSRDGLSGSMKIPRPEPVPETPQPAQSYTPHLTLTPEDSGTAFQTAPDQESQG